MLLNNGNLPYWCSLSLALIEMKTISSGQTTSAVDFIYDSHGIPYQGYKLHETDNIKLVNEMLLGSLAWKNLIFYYTHEMLMVS